VEPQRHARERNTTLENLLAEDGYPEEAEEEMKIRMAAWEYCLYTTAAFSAGLLVGWMMFA